MRLIAELDGVEQELVMLASEEGMLFEVAPVVARLSHVEDRTSSTPPLTVLGQLAREGFLWFYWLRDPRSDLSAAEVVEVFDDPNWARTGPDEVPLPIALRLTPEGEAIYYGPTA